MEPTAPRITVPRFAAFKGSGQKITVVTAYDYPTARVVDAAGVEAILVGDSLGMAVQGHETTLGVTLDQMVYHAEMVARGATQALVIVDLPFPTFQLGPRSALESAARILKETRAQAVKLEGGVARVEVIETLVSAGIPVMAHVGLLPQSVHRLGQYRVQRDRGELLADAQAAQQAGAFAVVLECIPAELAREITQKLAIPTIGIGAGPHCDGQVLVLHDMLGLGGPRPRHARLFAELESTILDAASRYRTAVRDGTFPAADESFQ